MKLLTIKKEVLHLMMNIMKQMNQNLVTLQIENYHFRMKLVRTKRRKILQLTCKCHKKSMLFFKYYKFFYLIFRQIAHLDEMLSKASNTPERQSSSAEHSNPYRLEANMPTGICKFLLFH